MQDSRANVLKQMLFMDTRCLILVPFISVCNSNLVNNIMIRGSTGR